MNNRQHIGSMIRRAREQHGLQVRECAGRCGLSEDAYSDVESQASELFENVSLGTARRICDLVGVDLLDQSSKFLNVQISERQATNDERFYSRHYLIAEARQTKGITETELADAIGFERVIVELLERTADFIESLPVVMIVDIASVLNLDPGLLLCNRIGVSGP